MGLSDFVAQDQTKHRPIPNPVPARNIATINNLTAESSHPHPPDAWRPRSSRASAKGPRRRQRLSAASAIVASMDDRVVAHHAEGGDVGAPSTPISARLADLIAASGGKLVVDVDSDVSDWPSGDQSARPSKD